IRALEAGGRLEHGDLPRRQVETVRAIAALRVLADIGQVVDVSCERTAREGDQDRKDQDPSGEGDSGSVAHASLLAAGAAQLVGRMVVGVQTRDLRRANAALWRTLMSTEIDRNVDRRHAANCAILALPESHRA